MLPSESLTHFHHDYLRPHLSVAPQPVGVFPIAHGVDQPSVPLNRRDFYQIVLYTSGSTVIRYAGHDLAVSAPALLLHHPLVPYACEPVVPITGFCCIFTADFLYGPAYAAPLQKSPLFQLGANPVCLLTDAQGAFLTQLFQQMLTTADSAYRYQLDLLRTHVQLLLHEALRLQPDPHPLPPDAPGRLATQFLQLLEEQFPVHSPARPLRLHTAEAFAAGLNVHVNYLSRVLRETTGKTTSTHLFARITQEARLLLTHTDWPIAEIADGLGFAEATYFNHFFRKHTGTSPNAFRRQGVPQPTRLVG